MRPPIRTRAILASACSAALAATILAGPPAVGPQQRIDVDGGTFAASETTGGVSAVNPNEIVAAWNDWRASPGVSNEVVRAGVALSADGGQTWTDFLVRPPAPNQSGVEGDPMTAYDPRTGTLWVGAISFAGNGGLYVARKDPGDDFFQPSVIADAGGNIDKCWMVAGRNRLTPNSTRLYIAYNLGVIRSSDFGDSWTDPVTLGQGLGFLPRIGPTGELYVAYWDVNQNRFELKRSLDGGVSFVTRVIALRMDTWSIETFNTRFPGTMRVPPLVSLDVDRTSGTLYAVWPDTTDFSQGAGTANVDVYFSKSVDSGETWSVPVVLNGEGPFVGDQFFPWIEVDPTGRLHVLFFDTRNTNQVDQTINGMIDVYYAYSEDAGASWNEIRLTPVPWNSANDGLNRPEQFLGDYLGMGVTDDHAWPIYPATHNGDTDIYTNEIEFCATIGEVGGLLLGKSADSSEISFTWSDELGAADYVVFQDSSPAGGFGAGIGTAASGTPGLTLEMPAGDHYFLVAGRNPCGTGPK